MAGGVLLVHLLVITPCHCAVIQSGMSLHTTSYMLLVAVWTPLSHIKPSNRSQHFSTVTILAAMFIYQTRKKESCGMGACVFFLQAEKLMNEI